MSVQRFLTIICPIICASCLVMGYAMVGQWGVLPLVIIASLVWIISRQSPSPWFSSAALAINISLAAAGRLTGASPFLMIPSAAAALASWDLTRFDQILPGGSSSCAGARLKKRHYQSLALALGPGLLIAVAGRIIVIHIQFVEMVLLVLLVTFTLDRVRRLLTN